MLTVNADTCPRSSLSWRAVLPGRLEPFFELVAEA